MFRKRRLLPIIEGAALFFLASGGRSPAAETPAPLEPAVFLAVDRAGDRVVVVGERGLIRYSDDRGATWKRAMVPTDVTLTAVRFADERTGWAAGHEGVILKTTDTGASWVAVREPSAPDPSAGSTSFFTERAPLFDILPVDSGRVWAVGAYGTALRSDDGGARWAPVSIEGKHDLHLFALIRDRRNVLWAAGEAGALYVSRDDGRSWVRQAQLTPGSFFGAAPTDEGGILLFGLRGRVFQRSPAGGWRSLPGLPERSLHGSAPLGPDRILLGGAGGTLVFVDTRTGKTVLRRLPVTRDIHCLLALDPDTVLVFSDGDTATYSVKALLEGTRP